jgi:hypothetical protein
MKSTLTLIVALLLLCRFLNAQTITYTIPVKDSHTLGSANYDTVISVVVGDTVQVKNYTSSPEMFGYFSNVSPSPIITASIPVGGVIHKWKISSTGYTSVSVVQSPYGTVGRKVYLNVSIGMDELSLSSGRTIVYPCPAKDFVTIEAAETIQIIELTGITGQVIDEFKPGLNIKTYHYNLPHVKGCYFLRINRNVTKLLLIE